MLADVQIGAQVKLSVDGAWEALFCVDEVGCDEDSLTFGLRLILALPRQLPTDSGWEEPPKSVGVWIRRWDLTQTGGRWSACAVNPWPEGDFGTWRGVVQVV